jgi:hypothetical protein
MSKWSDEFNKLDYNIRYICAMVNAEMRIQQLNFEKQRLIKRHRKSIREINAHIKNIREDMKESDNETN